MTHTTTPTCTIGPSAVTGERCGKPAVASFTSKLTGHVYHECAEHHVPGIGEPIATTKRPERFVMPSGAVLRSKRSTLYILAAEIVPGKPVVLKGSKDLALLRAYCRGFAPDARVIFDTTTGEVVR